MKRIGITQRRDAVPNRTEVRDALDVNWAGLLWNLGILPIPLCSGIENTQAYLKALNLDGFILSGGNDIGEMVERDTLESAILEYSKIHKRPVLGICRGMQFINHIQSGSLIKVQEHVATVHERLMGEWASELGISQVNSFHNYAINAETLGEDLTSLAKTEDGVIEAIKHNSYPWIGIMWHPERELFLNEWDADIIKKHFIRDKK
ncbi:glutamine amidotransferase [Vibrio cholerae]|uniref:gamma-glutamyl-gamma-aminobutyrate hydrolase family protein n=2 Tax=Bacteria TaxID=2 RepID=UPI00035F76BC|nr:gamma-glutamyl-gamma-aminobutyrate hydrolase family protein [Vibrio cholerae]EGQ7979420.1 glutamine amidotransferase [Vibrio cholerae]EGQ8531501.1 glutamine amidotransferase [Vibrio cholerae]EGQ8559301.1 glutamine amidotransferase [Vibrio cholerae]EGR0551022.1 glutamine amidotransferase [Vibrio cholerae]EJL6343443.1 gamma-glutamyl-gamma-aminobutyrate hydrolase family protein [Vibrio cholerae]